MHKTKNGIDLAIRITTRIICVLIIALLVGQKALTRQEPQPEATEEQQTEERENRRPNRVKMVFVNHQEPEEAEPETKYVYYDVPLSDDLQEYTQDLCDEYDFPCYDIIVAMIWTESGYREDIVSKTNDWGYMQINGINHQTLKEELGITNFLDGKQNIRAGVYMIQKLYHKYGDIGKALMAYNCGEYGASKLWKEGTTSTNYSRTIMQRATELTERN